MQTLILAGGKGTRLRPLTLHTPKPVVPIANRPFIYYQLDLLRPLDVTGTMEVLLSLSYQPRKIEEVLNQEVLGAGRLAGGGAPAVGNRRRHAPYPVAGDGNAHRAQRGHPDGY